MTQQNPQIHSVLRALLGLAMTFLTLTLILALPAAAQSTAELLEQGLYTEQTVGDLPAAIDLYQRVANTPGAPRRDLAQAHLRLGLSYRKTGDEAQARAAFERLIQDFPDQGGMVTQAQEYLASADTALDLEPAPWEDGELLQYRLRLPTGKTLGTLQHHAKLTTVDGVEAWHLELRRLVLNASENFGVSRVLVDRHTLRPLRSSFHHGALGQAVAVYGPDGVHIRGWQTETHVESDGPLYDNEQATHLFRALPLEPGYKTRFNVVPIWTAQIVGGDIKVRGPEACRVPAGDFECYVVQADLGPANGGQPKQRQTFWVSTGPERYLVKVKAEGVVIELTEIGRTEPGASPTFELEDFGFSGTLPDDWWTYEHRPSGRKDSTLLRLLDPTAAAISGIEVDRCPRQPCPALQETAEKELARAERRFEGFAMRPGSWTESTIDGRPSIHFVSDYRKDGESWVQYRLYTFTDDLRLEIIFRTPAASFDQLRPDFDQLVGHLRVE